MTTDIYLMRHGQTLFNVQKRIQGWSDSPLTEERIKQAKQAGNYLKQLGLTFDSLYCSTAERASDTLELATGRTDYKRLKGLKEMNFGVYEGQQEYLHPPYKVRQETGNYYEKFGGETDRAVQERLLKTITAIAEAETGKTILAVSHAGALAQFLLALGLEKKLTFFPGNCCVLEFHYEAGKFDLLRFIDTLEEKIIQLN